MFCSNCGKEISDNAAICVGCGRSVKKAPNSKDSNSAGWWWLGFFLPMVGLILFIVWSGDYPLKAKKVGWGALIGAIVSVAFIILAYVLAIIIPIVFALMLA